MRKDIVDLLARSGFRFVILTPSPDNDLLKRHFAHSAFTLERLNIERVTRAQKGSRAYQFFRLMRAYAYGNSRFHEMGTRKYHLRIFRQEVLASATTLFGKLYYSGIIAGAALAGRSRLLRRFIRWAEAKVVKDEYHRDLYERYKPCMAVFPSLGYSLDPNIMREAKAFGARIVSIVRSWDNTTSKGYAGVEPDHVFAWNGEMVDEIIRYHDVPPAKVEAGGIPHWDIYFQPSLMPSREEFMQRYGLREDRRIIYFAMAGPSNFRHNMTVTRHLLEAISSGEISEPCQLLVRVHPNYGLLTDRWREQTRELEEILPQLKAEFGDILSVSEQRIEDVGGLRILAESNQDDLKAIFSNIDLLVNIYSTQMIEGAIFDVPIVNAGYLPLRETDMPISVYEDFDHLRRIGRTGAIVNGHSREELVKAVNESLENRSRFAEQRRRLVDQEISHHRGTAGVHLANRLIELVGQ